MKITTAGLLTLAAAGTHALAADAALPKTKVPLERCVSAALDVHAGKVVKLEMKMERGVPVYEFDIESPDGRASDIECDASTGKIVEVEEEVESAAAGQFAAKTKVTEEQARQTALARHPGKIVEVEYEIEPDGRPRTSSISSPPAGRSAKSRLTQPAARSSRTTKSFIRSAWSEEDEERF
jgi:uncharacterized membrane protein YkoI